MKTAKGLFVMHLPSIGHCAAGDDVGGSGTQSSQAHSECRSPHKRRPCTCGNHRNDDAGYHLMSCVDRSRTNGHLCASASHRLLSEQSPKNPGFLARLLNIATRTPVFILRFVAKIGFPREWLGSFATKGHFFCRNVQHLLHNYRRSNYQRAVASPAVRSAYRRSRQSMQSSRIIDYLSIVL